jgi:signal transduction histidine kinase
MWMAHYTSLGQSVANGAGRRQGGSFSGDPPGIRTDGADGRQPASGTWPEVLDDAGGNLEGIIASTAQNASRLFGDHCSIRLLSDDGKFLRLAASDDPDAGALRTFQAVVAASPPTPELQIAMKRALEADEAGVVVQPDHDALRALVAPEHWAALERIRTRSALVVPLRAYGRSIGLLILMRHRPDAPVYADADVALAQEVARRAAPAVAYARLHADYQALARQTAAETATRVRLERDIQTLRAAEQTLEQARREAERANQAKSEFLSRMSHELRTPLNAVLGFAQLLEMDPLTSEQRESLGYILKAGKHLLDLINEVLDIARIEAGRLTVTLEAVPLGEVTREVLTLVAPLAAERAIHVRQRIPDVDGPVVVADRQRLKQILLNLLSNAVKYNAVGGDVLVTHDPGPGRIRVCVTDTGPGIPEEKRARLFLPFERLGVSPGGVEGTGLGLALSKRLTEAMGGTIGLEAENGQGSTFWFELPTADAAGDGSPSPLDDVALQAAIPEPGQRVFTVLYIEDNLANLELIERILARRPGIRLLSAMQGRIGWSLAREHHPDLILLDARLPDVPGEEILRRLQTDMRTRLIPVVVMSSEPTQGQVDRMMAAGAHACLPKPVDVKELIALVDDALKLRIT